MAFFTGSSERLRIDASGNIGIGTTSPYAKLSVVGEAVARNFTATSTTATSTIAGGLDVGSGAIRYDFSSGITSIDNLEVGNTFFEADAGVITWADLPVTSASVNGVVNSYTASINGNPLITAYSTSDGAGGVANLGVGIGTTTPWGKLAVNPVAGDANQFVIGSSTRTSFIVNPAGNIGIGTTTPTGKFVVVSGTENNQGGLLVSPTAFSNRTLRIDGNKLDVLLSTTQAVDSAAGHLLLQSASGAGNVGIGTTSPVEFVEAAKNQNAGTKILISNTSVDSGSGTNATTEFRMVGSAGNFLGGLTAYGDDNSDVNLAGKLVLSTGSVLSNGLQFRVAGSNSMIINNSGNVGIGTTSPSARLAVTGSGTGTGRAFVISASDGTERLYYLDNGTMRTTGQIQASAFVDTSDSAYYVDPGSASIAASFNGAVGIGTTTPANKLDVYGANPYIAIDSSNAGNGGLKILKQSAEKWRIDNVVADDHLRILANVTTEAVSIMQSGLVGIGTTTPAAKLVVTGGIDNISGAVSFAPGSSGNNRKMTITGQYIDVTATSIGNAQSLVLQAQGGLGGTVGIGTTTPVSTLSVQGSLCVRDTGSCGTTAGTIYATTAAITDIDLAENYQTTDATLLAGEIVSVDPANPTHIRRASQGDTTPLLGIVSTAPGILLGKEFTDSKPVALAGRVPVKVNLEGGDIAAGDRIALSSTDGEGRKVMGSEETVGVALESFTATSTADSIEVFVNLRHHIDPSQLFISSSGNVGLGTTTPAYKLHVIGDVAAQSFVNISTRSSKKDIEYLDASAKDSILEKIKNVGVATYRYNNEDESDALHLGLIAEEAPAEVLATGG
ncbi:MAG: tail fiber domain-containing protein, partial [Candidatus Paceibacterota bacterium]